VKILVIGRSGQLARALASAATPGVRIEAVGRPDIDLANADGLRAFIAGRAPDVVVNAAAYTSVDRAEDEPDRAFLINAKGAEAVARGAADAGSALVHVSTDYVFSGEKSAPYTELDETGPRSIYGVSKRDGELRVLSAHTRAVIVRTSWVFDARGANFVRTMLRLAKTRPAIPVVSDQQGSPTFAVDLADAIGSIASKLHTGAPSGIYHCTGAGEATWADFAREVFAQAHTRGGPAAQVTPILTAEYPTKAQRPRNSRLDCTKLASDYGLALRPWRDALSACMDEIAAEGWSVG
jgi:dTDP-4-dehydrorhamnose reductase